MQMPGKLFIISAPSGTGKNTLIEAFLQKYPHMGMSRVITYTSKTPHASEKQACDYYFISPEDFEQKIKEGFFLEYSTAYGTYRGTPSSILQDLYAGKSLFIILDRKGAQAFTKLYKDHILLWIAPCNLEQLEKRLVMRARENSFEIQKRLALAQREIEEEKRNPFYHYYLSNDDLEQSLNDLYHIVEAHTKGF